MARTTRRSGAAFILAGLLGAAFFWVTDPRLGPRSHHVAVGHLDWRHWLFVLRGSPDNVLDAANQALLATGVGFAGCVVLLLVGWWLLTRRPI